LGVIIGSSNGARESEPGFIAASIQFEYDLDELAMNITSQLVHKINSKTCG